MNESLESPSNCEGLVYKSCLLLRRSDISPSIRQFVVLLGFQNEFAENVNVLQQIVSFYAEFS